MSWVKCPTHLFPVGAVGARGAIGDLVGDVLDGLVGQLVLVGQCLGVDVGVLIGVHDVCGAGVGI
jgi:hypothetical protein